jgi:hypothetical protein
MKLTKIENYIRDLIEDERKFKNYPGSNLTYESDNDEKRATILKFVIFLPFLTRSCIDVLLLYFLLRFTKKSIRNKKIVYTERSFCKHVEGKLRDRIYEPIFTEDIIFINYSKEIQLKKINEQKVYNIGGLVKALSYIFRNKTKLLNLFQSYMTVNNLIIKNLKGMNVYSCLFYSMNGLSLVFSKYRNNVRLIEIQHGSIINYPPYTKPAPLKIADVFYVKNEPTIEYLKTHLNKRFPAEYNLIPYPKVDREFLPGVHLLYASTIEFNGLHPVIKEFLKKNQRTDIHLIIRLHPREREREAYFIEQLKQYKIDFRFDHFENWLTGNKIKNLIVISPWSSCIEESYDNGFFTIIIDPVGRQRFNYLLDDKRCFYSHNLLGIIERIIDSGTFKTLNEN